MIRFRVVFNQTNQRIPVKFKVIDKRFKVKFQCIHEVTKKLPYYEGNYVVAPSREPQILHTARQVMLEDVLVNAIPKEYGLITYDQNRAITIT